MMSIPKIIGVMSCGVVLCLGLSSVQAAEKMSSDPCANRKGGEPNLVKCAEETRQGIETIKGEVLRIDGNDFLVERSNGKEVRLHLDANTQMTEMIGRGDQIEAKVSDMNNEKRVLSIRHMQ
jgi:translation initiation factor IF-1